MKAIAKAILGTVMLVGTAAAVTTPASAGFSIGIGVGPGYYAPPPPVYYGRSYYGPRSCDPYSRFYNPYACDDYEYYDGPPVFVDGFWYSGPIRSRWYGGHREFWVRDGWRYSDAYRGGGHFYRGHDGWGHGGWDHGGWGHHGWRH